MLKASHNILFISYDGMTDPLGQSQVLPYLKGLSATGKYAITLISCEKAQEYLNGKSIIEEICQRNNIDWRPISYTKKPPVLSTLKDIFKIRKLAVKLHREKNFEIIHCRSYLSALVGQWMKKEFGTRFIFDMRGFWADERVDGNLWPQSSLVYRTIYKYFKKKEREFLEEADYTISLTNCAKDEIYSWGELLRNNPVKIQVIPCCVDLELFDPDAIDRKEVLQKREQVHIAANAFVLLYLGAVGTWYMLPEMLDFFKVLKKRIPEAVFLFVTAEDPEYIRAMAAGKGILPESVIILRSSRKEVPFYISVADMSIFFIKQAYSKKASSPTKQGELMAMGVPVICNAGVGDTDLIIDQYKSGIALTSFSEKLYEEAVARIEEVSNLNKESIRRGASDYFSLNKGIDLYRSVYEKVLNQ